MGFSHLRSLLAVRLRVKPHHYYGVMGEDISACFVGVLRVYMVLGLRRHDKPHYQGDYRVITYDLVSRVSWQSKRCSSEPQFSIHFLLHDAISLDSACLMYKRLQSSRG